MSGDCYETPSETILNLAQAVQALTKLAKVDTAGKAAEVQSRILETIRALNMQLQAEQESGS